MNVQQRMKMCRLLEQMEERPELSKRLGLENKSTFRGNVIENKFEKKRGK